MKMRHVCSWQDLSMWEKMMEIKGTPCGVSIHCGKCKPLDKQVHCHEGWPYAVQIGQVVHKRGWLKKVTKTKKNSLQKSCFIEKSVRYARPNDWWLMRQHCRRTLGDSPANSSFCNFSCFGGSYLLTTPNYSANIIYFLGLWGSWKLDS